jgi:hypothetical protein
LRWPRLPSFICRALSIAPEWLAVLPQKFAVRRRFFSRTATTPLPPKLLALLADETFIPDRADPHTCRSAAGSARRIAIEELRAGINHGIAAHMVSTEQDDWPISESLESRRKGGEMKREGEKRKATDQLEVLLLEGIQSDKSPLTRKDRADIRKEAMARINLRKKQSRRK